MTSAMNGNSQFVRYYVYTIKGVNLLIGVEWQWENFPHIF
jgi:hypothetical protein